MGRIDLPLNWRFGIRATTPDEIHIAAEYGFDFVDLDFNHRANVEEHKLALKAMGAEYGLSFTVHGAGSMFDRGDGFEATLRDIQTAAQFRPSSFTIHPIYAQQKFGEEELRAKAARISALVASAAQYDFPIAVENIIEQPDDFSDLFAAIPQLGLALDTGHAELVLQSPGNKSFGFLRRWYPRLIHIHVHDNRGGNSVRDDLHLEVGHGTIDYRGIVRELAHLGYQGTFLFEMDPLSASRSREAISAMLRAVWRGQPR